MEGDDKQKTDVSGFYGALVQLAIHGQENRWWMLYTLLMFNSILLLGCATILASQKVSLASQLLIAFFCGAGATIDGLFIGLASNYNEANDLYQKKVADAEELLPPSFPKPFKLRNSQVDRNSKHKRLGFIVKAVPLVLVALFAAIALLTWCPPLGC